jgi:hypothetical protein
VNLPILLFWRPSALAPLVAASAAGAAVVVGLAWFGAPWWAQLVGLVAFAAAQLAAIGCGLLLALRLPDALRAENAAGWRPSPATSSAEGGERAPPAA